MPNPCRICHDPEHTHNTHHLICVDCSGPFHKNKTSSKCPESNRAKLGDKYPVDYDHWMMVHRHNKWDDICKWFAGFMSAEGYIGNRPQGNGRLVLDISQDAEVDGSPCMIFRIGQHFWGGGIYPKHNTNQRTGKKTTHWSWNLTSERDVWHFIQDISPWVIERHKRFQMYEALRKAKIHHDIITISNLSKEELIPFACGFFEGDGCAYFHKDHVRPVVAVTQKDSSCLEILKSKWGGGVYKGSTGSYFWSTITAVEALHFLGDIFPFVSINYKKMQIAQVLLNHKESQYKSFACTYQFCIHPAFRSEEKLTKHMETCIYQNHHDSKICRICQNIHPLGRFAKSRSWVDHTCALCRNKMKLGKV